MGYMGINRTTHKCRTEGMV